MPGRALPDIQLTIFDSAPAFALKRRTVVSCPAATDESGDRENIMASLGSRIFIRRARPILWRRDYEAAKHRLLLIHKGTDGDERFLALLSELTDYERRNPAVDLASAAEWAECVFVPVLRVGSDPARRWSDGTA